MNFLTIQEKELKRLKKIRNHSIKHYDMTTKLKKMGIKLLIKADFSLPFIITGIVFTNLSMHSERNPFVFDKIKEYNNICTIENESGSDEIELETDDFSGISRIVEYSTPFVLNEDGFYEREFITFDTSSLDRYTKNELFSFNEEELMEKLLKIDSGVISKKTLEDKDKIYDEEGLYLTSISKEKDAIVRDESLFENFLSCMLLLLKTGIFGGGIFLLKKRITKDYVKLRLNDILNSFPDSIDYKNIDVMIDIREENLKLFR